MCAYSGIKVLLLSEVAKWRVYFLLLIDNQMLLRRFVTFSRTLNLLFSLIEGPRLHYFCMPPGLKLYVPAPLLPGHRQWGLLRGAGGNANMRIRQRVPDLIPGGSSGFPSPPRPTFLWLLLPSSSCDLSGSVHNTPSTLVSAWPSLYFSVSFFLQFFFFFLLNFSSSFHLRNI